MPARTAIRDPGRHIGWVEFDRASGSGVHFRMRELIARGRELAVIVEVFTGARTDAREESLLSSMAREHSQPSEDGPGQ